MRMLVYGAINPDLVHVVDRLPGRGDDIRSTSWHLTWGGKAANAAAVLAAWGVDTRLLGLTIGIDPLGDALMDALDRPHLDGSWIVRDPTQRTRHCLILVTPDGDRTIVCAGYEGAAWQPVPEAAWKEVDAVVVDGFGGAAAHDVVAEARRRGLPTVWLDAPDPPPVSVDLVVWSTHEHRSSAAARLAAGGQNVVVTAGRGTLVARWNGRRYDLTPPPVVAGDTTGAGDAFAAACALGLAERRAPEDILSWAAAAGAAVAAAGRPHLPHRDAVDGLVATVSLETG